ncbi:MAG: PHP-associated domain-containing protein [Candidatus Diapherotrites archaeon]
MARVFTFDLHTHIAEQKVKPEKFWERVKSVGLDGVAITEHADLNPAESYRKLLETKPEGVLLIPGIEMNTEYGHMLAYGKDAEMFERAELLGEKVSLETIIAASRRGDVLIALSHPWGFNYDSAGYLYGLKNVENLVIREHIGVEVYNGMIGNLSNFIYDSKWINAPRGFLDFMEKNRVARKVFIGKITGSVKRKVDEQSFDIIKRCANAIELGDKARFVVAGSDAHSADRVGTGILKLRCQRDAIDNASFLEELRHRGNVIWSGPLVREIRKGVYEKVDDPLRRMEIVRGLRYATRKTVTKGKIGGKIKETVLKVPGKGIGAKIKEGGGKLRKRVADAHLGEKIKGKFAGGGGRIRQGVVSGGGKIKERVVKGGGKIKDKLLHRRGAEEQQGKNEEPASEQMP